MTKLATCKACKSTFTKQWKRAVYCSLRCTVLPRIMVRGEDECWLWTGGTNDHGYGQLRINGECFYVHRLAYSVLVGPIPDELQACHTCDTPLCCNPAHIFIGTTTDNMRDMSAKGRAYKGGVPPPAPSGELHHGAKLTTDAVREIRALKGAEPTKRIAKRYRVDDKTIRSIMRGESWKHLLEPEISSPSK